MFFLYWSDFAYWQKYTSQAKNLVKKYLVKKNFENLTTKKLGLTSWNFLATIFLAIEDQIFNNCTWTDSATFHLENSFWAVTTNYRNNNNKI